MPPESTWGSKDREKPIEFESIAQFCHHQLRKALEAKIDPKQARNQIKQLFFDGFLLIAHF